MACSLAGERGFSAVCHSRGFRMRRGEGRSAMLPQFENLMISIFENMKVCHDYFSSSRRIVHVDKRRMVSNEINNYVLLIVPGTKPAGAGDALGRSASQHTACPSPTEQVLEN